MKVKKVNIIPTEKEKEAIEIVCNLCNKIATISPNEEKVEVNGYPYFTNDFACARMTIEDLIYGAEIIFDDFWSD